MRKGALDRFTRGRKRRRGGTSKEGKTDSHALLDRNVLRRPTALSAKADIMVLATRQGCSNHKDVRGPNTSQHPTLSVAYEVRVYEVGEKEHAAPHPHAFRRRAIHEKAIDVCTTRSPSAWAAGAGGTSTLGTRRR